MLPKRERQSWGRAASPLYAALHMGVGALRNLSPGGEEDLPDEQLNIGEWRGRTKQLRVVHLYNVKIDGKLYVLMLHGDASPSLLRDKLKKDFKFEWTKDLHGQPNRNAWIRKVADDAVIAQVEAFAADWGWIVNECAEADANK